MISNYSGAPDEGMKNIALNLEKGLRQRHEVLHLNLSRLFSISFWKMVSDFKPQIIHYVPGPTIKSFLIVRATKAVAHHAKTVMSATWPNLSLLDKKMIPFLRPDLIAPQSHEIERMFQELGCQTEFVPNGVDIKRFAPVPKEAKTRLREKYQIDKTKFVILHVGSIRRRRNIQALAKLQQEGNQVLIVGSLTNIAERNVWQSLEKSGCLVWRTMFPNIEEIYALSDCYVFPTTNRLGSVQLPLSVMEAMSCNLPVLSTRFGGLPRLFTEGDGLYFVEREADFLPLVAHLKNGGVKVDTREKVLPYTWEKAVMQLEEIYARLVAR